MGFHRPRAASAAAFAVYGAAALIAQLICLQELRLLFIGHELFLGLSLAAWMGWVGIGSWAVRQWPSGRLRWIVLGAVPVLAANLLLIRWCKTCFEFGMLIGLLPMTLLSWLLLAPIGCLIGSGFTLGLARASQRTTFSAGEAYGWEAAGAAIGGALYSWALIGHVGLEPLIAWLAIAMAVLLLALETAPRRRVLGVMLVLSTALVWRLSDADRASRRWQWRGYSIVAEQTTRYGHQLLARLGSLTTLFEDGVISSHFPDPAAHEVLAHLPLLAHPDPERVLLIGGAATGTLSEVLKHPLRQVDYLEADPALLPLLEPALPPADREALRDPRVRIVHGDARRWLMTATARYDVILLNLPPPMNAQINRLYTLEAFRAVRVRLAPRGLLALSIPSSENYLSPETRYFNAAIARTLSAAFSSVELVTGDQLLLLAGDGVRLDPDLMIQRYLQRGLRTRQVVPAAIPWQLDAARRRQVAEQLSGTRAAVNRDFSPVCYAYAWRVWQSKFLSPLTLLGLAALGALLGAACWLGWRRRDALADAPQLPVMFLLGYAGIVYETVLLLAFQALNGSVYWQLGTLFAVFMLGLAIGSWIAQQPLLRRPAPSSRRVRSLLCLPAIEGAVLACGFSAVSQRAIVLPWLPVFGSLLLLTGAWLGAAFAVLTAPTHAAVPAPAAAAVYAADLWGAALGALLTGTCLVPLFGLAPAAGLTGAMLLVALLLLPVRART